MSEHISTPNRDLVRMPAPAPRDPWAWDDKAKAEAAKRVEQIRRNQRFQKRAAVTYANSGIRSVYDFEPLSRPEAGLPYIPDSRAL